MGHETLRQGGTIQPSDGAWQLRVPPHVRPDAPLVCVPTIHPRGDQRVVRCAQAALDAGLRVTFVWLGEIGIASGDASPFVGEIVLPPANSFRTRLSRIGEIVRAARRVNASIWHIHDFYLLEHARRWRWSTGRPVVFDVHEYYPEYYSSKLSLPSFLRNAATRLLERYQASVVARLGAADVVAEEMAPAFQRRGVQVAVSPNYPLAENVLGHRVLPWMPRKHRVIHTGTLSETYGMRLLVEIAALAHERGLPFSFDLVDRFPNAASRQVFERTLREFGEPPNLRLIDPVPAHRLSELLSTYGIGVSTVQKSGQNEKAMPTKLYEYTLMGLAVVATPRAKQAQFVHEWSVGAVGRSDRADEMVVALSSVAQWSESKAEEIAAGAQRARASLLWNDTSGPAVSALFTSLMR